MGGTKRGLMGSADTGVLAWAGWLVWLGWSGLRRGRRIGLACRAGWAGLGGLVREWAYLLVFIYLDGFAAAYNGYSHSY